MAKRQAGMARAKRANGQDPGRSAHYEQVENWDGIELVPEALGDPLKWRKARRVFVCSMGDLFHEDVPDYFISKVFRRMLVSTPHTFQLLTKRPGRMLEYIKEHTASGLFSAYGTRFVWPPSNVHFGVTAEDQQRADERIPLLLEAPAAVRFVSLEPLLGGIELPRDCFDVCACGHHMETHQLVTASGVNGCMWGECKCQEFTRHGLDQIIVGAETGPGKREMKLDWARSLRDQCQAAGVPFFFKKDSDGNRLLDGVKWEQMPR